MSLKVQVSVNSAQVALENSIITASQRWYNTMNFTVLNILGIGKLNPQRTLKVKVTAP